MRIVALVLGSLAASLALVGAAMSPLIIERRHPRWKRWIGRHRG